MDERRRTGAGERHPAGVLSGGGISELHCVGHAVAVSLGAELGGEA